MSKLRVHCFGVSLDGFGAGPDQSLENPLGAGGENLHEWFFPTRVFQKMQGNANGTTGLDNDFAERGFDGIGAWILGRNMFGPVRGAWPNDEWKGWWGEEPPYHTPVFVLTHYPRAPIQMEGGTTFHFVTDGIHAALQRAREAAGALDVRVGGGPATIRQYLQSGLIDEMHIAVSPIILGRGESLLAGLDLAKLGYKVSAHQTSAAAMHAVITK
ncbi:MAG TPA: dihydrofolate reductase family protein [Verrucomicrobiales bacterium]|jgi:dihydrofolate reductase|nr:dihydrofolate reductase family protein [Verrucomicrobiales bacterium]